MEKTKIPNPCFNGRNKLVYTHFLRMPGIHFHENKPPIPTKLLDRLILQEKSFQFNGKNYLQMHSTTMDAKMAVALASICMAKVETEILSTRTTM